MGFEVWNKVAGGKSNGMSGVRRSKSSTRSRAANKRKNSKKSTSTSNKTTKSMAEHQRKADRDYKAQELKWRAESDLDTLSRANEILDSPDRVKAAQRIAQEKADAAQEAAKSIGRIGKGE